jgi:hypothetical protein
MRGKDAKPRERKALEVEAASRRPFRSNMQLVLLIATR